VKSSTFRGAGKENGEKEKGNSLLKMQYTPTSVFDPVFFVRSLPFLLSSLLLSSPKTLFRDKTETLTQNDAILQLVLKNH
jgi:hypothetical protein